jgi:hypothetical protein
MGRLRHRWHPGRSLVEPQRPPEFGPGESCRSCVFYNAGTCKKYAWEVSPEDWCKSYKSTPGHEAAFRLKDKRQKGS